MKFSAALLLFLSLCFWGLTSSELGSSCYSSPCKNGGTCEDAEGSYRCLCPQNPLAYVGWNCEFLYEACGGHACPPELVCSGTPGQLNYTCLCRPGQMGLGCNSEADMCEASTCPQPHFECITINNGYGCQCRNRESCQIQSSLCSSNPCHNNGTCIESAGQYICKCQLGHVGTHCEEDVDECASSPCQNGAICLDRVNEYSCFCVPGFQGHHCEIDINECASRPCQHNSTCLNQMDHYVCQCLPGYTGMNCDVEIDECISDPCWNGGTCNDHIGLFTCSCMPGFEGVQCEEDINECQSQPCLNGGMCHDLVNSYYCDCHNTGFEGEHCELDILECASQPCQNGATCLEGVGRYSCDCWPGYVGKHCEEDVNECTTEPCFNGGQCYEKSNQSYYGELMDFPAQFSYQEAAGFICRCQPGFAGDICTINIDECESQPCQNGGSCMDLVNSYWCQCVPGYSGLDCAIEINECEDHPCENGGACEDGIADYICHCIPGQGGITWGGKNCSVELTGCQAHHCQNEALCVPTYQSETHGYMCQCQPGFYGSTCSISTTFSFSSSTYLFISLSADNKSSSDTSRGDLCAVALRFRTTLPDAILIHRGHKEEHLLLELSGGLVRVTLMMQDSVSSLTLEAPRVDDGFWHNVEVRLQGSLELRLWHEDCHASICWQSCPLAESFSNSLLFSSEIYIGGTDVQLMTNSMQSFIGCLEDLYIDSKVVLPQEMIGSQSSGVQLGCERTDWCHTQPCSHGGQCIDLWADYYCDCSRPYEGHTCSFESPTVTFGLENSSSFATFAISNSPGANFNLSFFIRTLKPMGLVFHINNGTETLLAVYLMDGQLQIEVSTAAPISISGQLADGRRHFVMLSFHEGFVYANLLNREEHLGPLKVTPLAVGSEIHIGGLLDEDSVSLWGGYFKGCLQDIRLNHHQMQFFGPEGDRPEELFVEQKTNVFLGCISDDTCKSSAILCKIGEFSRRMAKWNPAKWNPGEFLETQFLTLDECETRLSLPEGRTLQPEPCFNGGHCSVTWNDFICSCTANFTGKSCEERVWCESEPCSQATTCVDVPSGYVCLSNATFHGHDAVEFTTNASITRALHSLRLDFRTRDEDAILLRVVQEVDSLLVAVQNSSLLVEIRSGNGIEGVNFLSQMSISDGSWHMLLLSMEESSSLSSRWHLYLDGSMNTTLQGHAGSLDFIKNNAIIILAENFTGCLGHADIGGVFLPLAAHNSYPQPEQFLQLSNKAPLLGCKGANMCASSPCHHAGSCQDLFNAFHCVCTAGWEGLLCEANIDDCNSSPCIHGKCVDEVADFQCECDKGYIGKRCHINVDDCIRHQCQNGGTCVDGVYSYTCTCPPQYTGPHCEWPFPPEQCGKNFTCLNGGTCTSGSWGANCTCKPGYAGRKCQININECDPNPCQNGGTCQDSINRYRCVCSASYTGERCDVDRGTPSAFSPFPLIEVAVPVACGCLLLLIIILILMILTARKRRQSEGTYSPSQQEVAGARLEMDSVLKRPAWAQISSSTLVGAVGAAGAAVLITIFGISVIAMKKRRATQGTYSPSRQEKDGARVEMWNVIKLPPMERLI